MLPILTYALPAMSICRNFPIAIVFSSTKYAGMGIKHLHTLQEISRLKDILHHTYANTTTGNLYRTSFEYLILEVGMGTDLTAINYNKYSVLATDCLIKSTWEFIYQHSITIEHDVTVPPNMERDIPLMPEICKAHPSITELEYINQY
jgi:hypothetical protein